MGTDCGAGYFPKEDGWVLYAEDVNILHGNFVSMRSTEAETAMNITKLQYCQSVTDINHDYMVVDVFTDATGYNNTICTNTTTSTYCDTGLNGYYLNSIVNMVGELLYYCTRSGKNTIRECVCVGDYLLVGCASNICAAHWGCGCSCICKFIPDISKVNMFCFTACCYLRTCSTLASNCNQYADMCILNFIDSNFYCCKTGSYDQIYSCSNSYCFIRICGDSFCYYKNDLGVCCIIINEQPNIIVCGRAEIYCYANSYSNLACFCFSLNNICTLTESKITTVETQYDNPVATTYLSLDKEGCGTVVYNVINPTNNCCIACNLVPNCLYSLNCCIQCHAYEIVQCEDGVSCIKSYAILTGVY